MCRLERWYIATRWRFISPPLAKPDLGAEIDTGLPGYGFEHV
jgi:hypothetical protein